VQNEVTPICVVCWEREFYPNPGIVTRHGLTEEMSRKEWCHNVNTSSVFRSISLYLGKQHVFRPSHYVGGCVAYRVPVSVWLKESSNECCFRTIRVVSKNLFARK
jgi:hypothetical protein